MKINTQEGELNYCFYCPGCKIRHGFNDSWKFNGDMNNPTIKPSILVKWSYGGKDDYVKHVCHSYITEGKIRFLNDCTHELAGQTVELPEL